MRRVLFLFIVAVGVAVPASQRVAACGDKFMQVGRGMLQQHYAPRYPASILLFAPRSGGKFLLKEQQFQSALELAGHKVVVVQDGAGLSQVLQTRRFDLALVGQSDLEVFASKAASATSVPTVLPVKNTKGNVAACKQQYDCRLTMNDRLDEYLMEMDKQMTVRTKAAARNKK